MRHDAFVLKLEIVPFFFVPVPPCVFYIANPSNTVNVDKFLNMNT